MPGCTQVQAKHISTSVAASLLQRIENTGLKSSPSRWRVVGGGTPARPARASEAADFAGQDAAIAWRRHYQDWLETGLPRASTDLFARLPFNDSVKLAALAGTARMTWPEINAALDAMIKLAAANTLDGQCRHDAPATRHVGQQTAEAEIWARYHAQCDEVFGNDAGPGDTSAQSAEQLWRTERILDRLRSARDRELAALRWRLGAQPTAAATSAIRMQPSAGAMPWTELSPAERAALSKLDASGFVGSAGMSAAIDGLIGEIAGSLDSND